MAWYWACFDRGVSIALPIWDKHQFRRKRDGSRRSALRRDSHDFFEEDLSALLGSFNRLGILSFLWDERFSFTKCSLGVGFPAAPDDNGLFRSFGTNLRHKIVRDSFSGYEI